MGRCSTSSVVLYGVLVLNSAACGSKQTSAQIDPQNATLVQRGLKVYQEHCARCHGANLEGQPNWRERKSDGRLPAPPHDDSGHTWHHSNAMLIEIVKRGLVPPHAPSDYQSDMPAFEGMLGNDEIAAVLSYMQSRWSADTHKFRRENHLNESGE